MKRILTITFSLLCCACLYAQNGINQSVEVSNEYQSRLSDLKKGNVEMNVPDSLLHFDYSFDYSVFDSPYKGAYEFSPYFIKLNPSKSVYDGKKLFIRAGAGYSLNPEIDFWWSAVQKENFYVSVFNNGSGFWGEYTYMPGDPSSETYSGHDASDNLGVLAGWVNKYSKVSLKAGWDGIFSKSPSWKSGMNSVYATLGVKAKNDSPSFFYYDFNLGYRYTNDCFGELGAMNVSDVSLFGSVGPVIQRKFRLLIDFKADFENIRDGHPDMDDAKMFLLNATPHLKFALGPVSLDAGVKVDFSSSDEKLFSLSPAVTASMSLVKDKLEMYAGFVGGQTLHDYYSLKAQNHFHIRTADSPTVSQTRYNAYVGFKGTLGKGFDYDLSGGYMDVDSGATPYMTYLKADFSKAFVDLSLAYRNERINFDMNAEFVPYSTLQKDILSFSSPKFKGDARFVYNWSRRIYAGVWVGWMSARKSRSETFSSLPFYISPGVYGEYMFSDAFGVWVEGGNLLGHKIYTTPGYSHKGPYFTLGISYKL